MKDQTCEERIDAHLADLAKTMTAFMEADDLENVEREGDPFDFYEYGLGFGYVEPGTFEGQNAGYYQYQLSWGGPSDEIRFHPDGSIEYRFHDWFDGAGRDISHEPWAKWLEQWFTSIEMIDWGNVEE